MSERNLAEFAFSGFLRDLGWPRTVGRFRKKVVVDLSVVDAAHSFIARLGMGLGAGRPRTAARLLADMYKGPTTQDEWTELIDGLLVSPASASRENPWDAMFVPFAGTSPERLVPVHVLEEAGELKLSRYGALAMGAAFGLCEPKATRRAFKRMRGELSDGLAEFGAPPGLASFEPPRAKDWIRTCDAIVVAFEQSSRRLAALPASLLSEPRIAAAIAARDG